MDQLTINLALQMAKERDDQLTRESESRLRRQDASGTNDGANRPAPEFTRPRRLPARRPRFGRRAAAY